MTNRELINSVNVSLRFNMGKAVITLFLIYILTVFLSTTVITVSLLSSAMIIPVVFGFVLCSIFVMLYLGYAILLAKLYSGKRAVIGDIFFPFIRKTIPGISRQWRWRLLSNGFCRSR